MGYHTKETPEQAHARWTARYSEVGAEAAAAGKIGAFAAEHAEVSRYCQPTYVTEAELEAAYNAGFHAVAQRIADITPDLSFLKVIRDCPRNDAIGAGGRGLIYDYQVVYRGEHIANWGKVFSGKGYELEDREGKGIRIKYPNDSYMTYRPTVKTKAGFIGGLALYWDHIPTAADLEDRKAAAARAKLERIAKAKAEATDWTVKKFAAEMLHVLKHGDEAGRARLIQSITGAVAVACEEVEQNADDL
jgi:hypothetical protein